MDLLSILIVLAALVIMVTFRVYINKKKQQEIASYLGTLSCPVCDSNKLYVDTRSMRRGLMDIFGGDTFTVSCFDCGNTWKKDDMGK